jgi:hypothetical protein
MAIGALCKESLAMVSRVETWLQVIPDAQLDTSRRASFGATCEIKEEIDLTHILSELAYVAVAFRFDHRATQLSRRAVFR